MTEEQKRQLDGMTHDELVTLYEGLEKQRDDAQKLAESREESAAKARAEVLKGFFSPVPTKEQAKKAEAERKAALHPEDNEGEDGDEYDPEKDKHFERLKARFKNR